MRTLLCGLGLATLLTGSAVVAPAPASAAPCSGTEGVTVVVQAGNSATTACAPGDPDSGTDALASAGFSVEQVQSQPGVVCTIDEQPATSCVRMPPADEYWAFYHADAGDTAWTYSRVSIAEYDPEPGASVGFRLGDGSAEPARAPADTTDASDEDGGTGSQQDADDGESALVTAAIGGGLLIVLAGGAVVVARRRAD